MNFNPQQYFFLVFLLAIGLLLFGMLLPYLQVLALAAALAVAFKPIYRKIHKFIKGYDGLAAFLTVTVAVVMVLVPVLIVGALVFSEAGSVLTYVSYGSYKNFNAGLLVTIHSYFPNLTVNVAEYTAQVGKLVANSVGPLLSSTFQGLINFFIGLLAFFYILKDGDRFAKTVVKFSPLKDDSDRIIMDRLDAAVYSILTGTVIVAVIQGLVAGIGYAIFGLPNPALWGSVTVLTALIPGFGTALVIVPAFVYLVVFGKLSMAIGLGIWGIIVVGLIDNFIRPLLIGRGFNVHPFLILLSVIGGLSFFGPLGILLGPLTLSLFAVLLDISQLLTEKKL